NASMGMGFSTVFPEPLKDAAPEPTPVSPTMIQAARKEGMVAFYTAMAIPAAETLGKTFEAKYPGIAVRVKRSGAQRVFQRVGKEGEIGIYGVDVVWSTDAAHFIHWKRDGLLDPRSQDLLMGLLLQQLRASHHHQRRAPPRARTLSRPQDRSGGKRRQRAH